MLKILSVILISLAISLFLSVAAFANQNFYYISCTESNPLASNSNDGLSPGRPWVDFTNASGVNFLTPYAKVFWDKACSYENKGFSINSSGYSRDRKLFIGTYGVGTGPKFYDSVDLAIYHPVFALDDAIYNVWSVAVDSIPWTPDTMSMNNAIGMQKRSSVAELKYGGDGFYRSSATSYYIRLEGGLNPNSQTFRLGRYTSGYNGVINVPQGYHDILIYGLNVYDSNEFGYAIRGERTDLVNISAERNSKEGVYFGRVDVALTNEGAKDSRLINGTVRYNNCAGAGNGQGVTIEAPRVGIYDSLIEYNYMAGLDVLDYQEDTTDRGTDASAFIFRNVIRNNGYLRHKDYSTDPQLYIDGGHDTIVADNIIYGGGQQSITNCKAPDCPKDYTATNYQPGVSISTEHCGKYPNNIYLLNNLVFGNKGEAFTFTDGSCSGDNLGDIHAYGNTFKTGTGAYHVANFASISSSANFYNYNNIYYGGNPVIDVTSSTYPRMLSNNNIIYANGIRVDWTTSYTLSQWRSLTGNDSASLDSDPKIKNDSLDYPSALWNTAEGNPSNSPAIGAADPAKLNFTFYAGYPGSYRLDGVRDILTAPAIGYHSNWGYDTWNGSDVSTSSISGTLSGMTQ